MQIRWKIKKTYVSILTHMLCLHIYFIYILNVGHTSDKLLHIICYAYRCLSRQHHILNLYQTSIEPLSNIYRTSFGSLSNIYRTTIKHRSNHYWTSTILNDYRTSLNDYWTTCNHINFSWCVRALVLVSTWIRNS